MSIEKEPKKLSLATYIIVFANLAIFGSSFKFPDIAWFFALAVLGGFIFFLIIKEAFSAVLVALLKKMQNSIQNIEDDLEREQQHVVSAVLIIFVAFFILLLVPTYRTWRSRLFGLLSTSLLATATIVFFARWDVGQNLTVFSVVVSSYIFFRSLIYFTLTPLDESSASNPFSHALKIFLELTRIIFILAIVLERDGVYILNCIPSSALEGVIATLAIDAIMMAWSKFSAKKDVTP